MREVGFKYFPFKDIFEQLNLQIELTPNYDCPFHENGNYYLSFDLKDQNSTNIQDNTHANLTKINNTSRRIEEKK